MFTFASTVITGVFSMAFSKNVIEHEGVVSGSKSFYDLSINDINGEEINLERFKGKKVMIVNVASRCGYTCLLYTSPSPRDAHESRMPSSA